MRASWRSLALPALLLGALATAPAAGICDPEYLTCPAAAAEEAEDGSVRFVVGNVGVTLDLRKVLHENEQSILVGQTTGAGPSTAQPQTRTTTKFEQGDSGVLVVTLDSTGANVTSQVWLGVGPTANFTFTTASNSTFIYSDADAPVVRSFPFDVAADAEPGKRDLKFGIAVGHADGGTYTYIVTVKENEGGLGWNRTPALGAAAAVVGLLAIAALLRRDP